MKFISNSFPNKKLSINRKINIAAKDPIKTFNKALIFILRKRKSPKRNVGVNKIE
tara:strand:- start:175 stop:339 length:165 start_codon:yes stop_codon:yes gene_type:complete